jgi:CubicO group peptidase (beta-lactamase class C family)
MRLSSIILTFSAYLLFACNSSDSIKNGVFPPKINTDNLNVVLNAFRAKYDIPAMVLAVFTPDTVLLASNGIKDVISKKKVSVSDQFHLGSCTKAMTAFLLARFIEKGKLQWNTSIVEVFPEWESSIIEHYRTKTIADLLSHRAGIQLFRHGIELADVPKGVFQGTRKEKRKKFTK